MQSLSILYNKILRVLARMPDEAHYKRNTQLVIQQRLQLVNAEQNVEKLEAKVNGGQVEELIKQVGIVTHSAYTLVLLNPSFSPITQLLCYLLGCETIGCTAHSINTLDGVV